MFSCFSCIPPPASRKPRKLYNLIIPDVFPDDQPDESQPLPQPVLKRIEKLCEYAQCSPTKLPKVQPQPMSSLQWCHVQAVMCWCCSPQISRRLARRARHAMDQRQFGYLHIALTAYAQLFHVQLPSASSFRYLLPELLHAPYQLIHQLLTSHVPQMQAMGARLVGSLAEAGTPQEHPLLSLHHLVPLLLAIMEPPGSSSNRSASQKGVAPPHDSQQQAAAQGAALQALLQYTRLCGRLQSPPPELLAIQESYSAPPTSPSPLPHPAILPGSAASQPGSAPSNSPLLLSACQTSAWQLLTELQPLVQHSPLGAAALHSLLAARLALAQPLTPESVQAAAQPLTQLGAGSSGLRALIRGVMDPSQPAVVTTGLLQLVLGQDTVPPAIVLSVLLHESLGPQSQAPLHPTPLADSAPLPSSLLTSATAQLADRLNSPGAVLEVVAAALHAAASGTSSAPLSLPLGDPSFDSSTAAAALHQQQPAMLLALCLVAVTAPSLSSHPKLQCRPSLLLQRATGVLDVLATMPPSLPAAGQLSSALRSWYAVPQPPPPMASLAAAGPGVMPSSEGSSLGQAISHTALAAAGRSKEMQGAASLPDGHHPAAASGSRAGWTQLLSGGEAWPALRSPAAQLSSGPPGQAHGRHGPQATAAAGSPSQPGHPGLSIPPWPKPRRSTPAGSAPVPPTASLALLQETGPHSSGAAAALPSPAQDPIWLKPPGHSQAAAVPQPQCPSSPAAAAAGHAWHSLPDSGLPQPDLPHPFNTHALSDVDTGPAPGPGQGSDQLQLTPWQSEMGEQWADA
ncbi:hypothetical protein QJQ45_010311 [Haematococcus lacustris]|nr:hypothetical protein QJQ45_010311 [Haematococcus lacustris]